ncbi:MAG: 4Fe-4S dicluster domain-containing protein [Nitrospirota bacterium]|jgi:ferredoxin
MALMINNHCIACDACLPACPNQAIFEKRSDAEASRYRVSDGQGLDGTTYVISHDRCTECAGHFDQPQCASVCPIGDCCVPDSACPESTEVLLARAQRLHPHKRICHDMVWHGVRA